MSAVDRDTSKVGDVADAARIRRIHVLAWRDLDDVEAGGSEVHAAELAARWAAAGLDVVVRTSHAHGRPDEAMRDGYRVIRRGGRHSVFLQAPAEELLRRAGRRDALLEVWNGMPFFSPLWARGPRATFVHHVHADMWRQVLSPALARVGETIELRVAPAVYRRTRIITPSPSAAREIVRRLGLRPNQITPVANGVDPAFSPGGERAPRPTILSVGRLVPHKRVDRLIRACHSLVRTLPDLELVIVSEGHERPALERLVRDLDATSFVRMVGHLPTDELVEHYRRAWVLASASSDEGWGMSITEAAACGTPAVATRIPGHLDTVHDDVTGLLVGSDDELRDALRAILTDHRLRARLGTAALEAAAGLSWDRSAVEVLRVIAGQAPR